MKTIFIPAKVKSKVNNSRILEISKQLPKNIVIAYSIQFQDIALQIKQILSKTHTIIQFVQVLGCSKINFQKNAQAILLIGNGRFHAISLALETKLPIYLLDKDKLERISEKDMNNLKLKQKASYLKFLNADRIGILISTKSGQQRLKRALELKNKIKDKKIYFFLADNINSNEFENFNLDSWINTACPRLDMDHSIINISRL